MTGHTPWKQIKFKHSHLTEANALRAGESAFKAKIYFSENPYGDNPCKAAWIRGYKRAERAWNELVKRSIQLQETLPLEEVE